MNLLNKRLVSLLLAMVMIFGMVPGMTIDAFAAEQTAANEFEGKTISILGDSISTFSGVSNSTSYNSTIGSNAVYYSAGTLGVYRADTWWQQTIDALGMELLVNNSWSGSTVLYPRKGEESVGYGDRCVNLHNDTTGEKPDVIVVFLGTNDFSYYQSTLGTADIDYDTLITADGYTTPTTTCEAYAIMLDKMISRYPNAEIYCMGLTARRSPDKDDSYADVGQPTAFNAELKQVIEHFGVTYVDLENCGIDAEAEVFDTYMGDGRVHPNALGMDKITEALTGAMLGQDVSLIDVATNYTGVVSSNSATVTLSGMVYSATLTAMEHYSDMTVTITMDGTDITASAYADGVISIPSVTGDLVITATASRVPQTFRWEYRDGELVSVGDTENVLTKLNGSCSSGVFTDTRYQLAGNVILLHNRPWVVEWKGEGAGGFMLAGSSNAAAAPFFFRRAGNYLNAFGDHDGSKYNNYGLTYADGAANHTYRLENRIADDGSNMVYLLVDGEEIGPMTGYYVGGNAQNTSGDWISGQDFTFCYIGTSSHPLTNYAMEYLLIEESAHTHNYTAAVTAPTCTEQGYTTYTCECGDSYVGDYVEAYGLHDVDTDKLYNAIAVKPGQLDSSTDGTILESDVYGFVVNYPLKKGHILSISDENYVFSVRKLENGSYSTLLKSATSDSYAATEDMTVGMLIRKSDSAAVTAEELASIVIYDSQFGMIDVDGSVKRFTVEAETIDGSTATTRAAIFLPPSYSNSGDPTRLIIMTNGLHGHLTDSIWNANTADDVGVMRHYMDNGYAVIVVNNTANKTSSTTDLGNPQLVSSYWEAYEYAQANFNVEEMFSIHSRSQGTFAAMRLMREHPELVKCAIMCGAVLSIQSRFSQNPAFIAGRYGFDDLSGATWEADKVVGYDPYTDVNGLEYDLPPTFWVLAESDATTKHLSVIEKIKNHGNDVTQTIYTETDHSGVCRLNIEACRVDSLAFLEKYQDAEAEHRFCAWETVKEATCTEAGELRRYCADCEHYETLEIPALNGHVFESSETVCDTCGVRFDIIRTEITLTPGHFNNTTGAWVESDTYGCVIGYELKAGHTMSISNTDYVFAVRILKDGSYATMVKDATADAFTAEEDMTIAVRVRTPDKSALTEEEIAAIVLIDTVYTEHSHTYSNGICTGCGVSVFDGGYTAAVPENQGVQNVIDRARALTDVEWTPIADMPGIEKMDGVYTLITFEAGKTYKGIPYSGVTANDCYVGLNVSLESFLTALENENSVLYTENLNNTNSKAATYFGTVCSKFAQYALNIPGSYNTNNVANIPGMETIALPGEYTVDQIKLGDVIVDTSYHTTICTDLLYDADGNVAFVEISEAISPVCRRLYWSADEFYEHFADYRLCRYDYIAETPSVEKTQVEDSYALMPRFGTKYNYKVSATKGIVDILESGYFKAVILRDGIVIDEITLDGAASFTFDRSVPGYLEMYLERENGTRSDSVYACVVKSSVSVEGASQFVLGKLTVAIDGSCGTPLYVQVGSAHAVFCNVEGREGTVEITFPFSKVSNQQVRVAYQNEYGVYLSSWVSFTAEENPSNDPLLSQGKYWNGYNITPSRPTPVVQENKVGYWSYTMIPVEENTTYYSVGATRLWYLDANGDSISTYNAYKDSDIPFRFTTPEDTAYVNIAYSLNLVEQGVETLVHVHTYENGICTECGESQPGPAITKQPESVQVALGEKFSVTVEAEGEDLTYQWYYKQNGSDSFAASSFKSNAYAMTMASHCHNRQIYCVITDRSGNCVQTETVTITAPLTITKQPADAEVAVGDKFSISVQVLGDGLTYQWYCKNAGSENFVTSCFRGGSYAMTMRDYCHERQVYCVITDAYGNSVTSEIATITRPTAEPVILSQPQDAQVEIGQRAVITVKAQGEGLTYQWYCKNDGSENFVRSCFRSDSYAMTMAEYCHNRQVYCVITDKYGNSVTTETATMTCPARTLKILEQPTDVYATKGEKISIGFTVQGEGLSYQWYYKNSGGTVFRASSLTGKSYSVTAANGHNGRQVYCVITDRYGNQVTTDAVTIHVEA